jgi:hypothetical protein
MAYTQTAWVPRQGTNLNKFAKSAETSGSVILVNTPDAVTQAGTPFSVENMNKIEQGIYDAHQSIAAHLAEEPIGYFISFAMAPSEAQMPAWRCLPAQGQVITISSYQRLCDMMYVGNAANATADWWYKTSDPQGTVRDVNGAYMRVLDHRGLFTRAAGQNSKYKMANDTPYDGMPIGGFIGDAMRDINGEIEAGLPGDVYQYGSLRVYSSDKRGSVMAGNTGWVLQFAPNVPTALENRPASISAYVCIKY